MTPDPALRLLMGAYFFEDWPEEYGSIWRALDDFVEGEPRAADAVPQIEALLARHTEDELADIVHKLGASYNPAYDGLTYRGWLEEVARRITAALADRGRP